MSQTQGEKPGQPATARAEELLDQMGQRVSLFAARASQSIQNAAASIREEADQMDQPDTAPGEKSSQPTIASAEEKGQLAMERAEELVTSMAQRLGHFASLAGLQILKATARVREEAEDIWAEAQNIHHENRRKLQ